MTQTCGYFKKSAISQIMRQFLLLAVLFLVTASYSEAKKKYKTLIVTGQNGHDWTVSTPLIQEMLEDAEIFTVDVATAPPRRGGADMSTFLPDFKLYDLVVLDYDGALWPEPTQKAFVEFVKNGGGVVIYHAADNPFSDWKEFNEIIGLGGWGGRNEKAGPYVYYKDGKVVRDTSPGVGGSHGPEWEYIVETRAPSHPIMKGLPAKWLHTRDELYQQLRGPGLNMEILATTYADPAKKGTGRDEPMLFTIKYGKGRIFHTVLGHVGVRARDFPAVECVGFKVTFLRGSEWAASGKVKQKVPADFPTETQMSKWAPKSLPKR